MKAAPAAAAQHELAWAIALCDRVVSAAEAAAGSRVVRRGRRPRR